MNYRETIYVYADWNRINGPILMGILYAENIRGSQIFSFEYDKDWLTTQSSQLLDPDLQFFPGPQYLNDEQKNNFSVFLDSSPDRWGRLLMQRREAALARQEKRKQKHLFESDYLLGLYDGHRMGALRFKTDLNGPFLDDNEKFASPPWAKIRTLEQISLKLEEENVVDDPEYTKWLNMLVAPGSSLGGARPKASIIDENKQLWIAKFPSKHDSSNVGAWEKIANEMAKEAGINMATSLTNIYSGHHHTYLTKRFDRTPGGERLHFASALTLLNRVDGDNYATGAGYLELVEFIQSNGARVNKDLEELWRRIVFSICVSNVDDHLRNHGFILTDKGWILSPAYDINPVATGTGLSLNISENDNSLDLDLVLEVIEYFRIRKQRAIEIIKGIQQSVKNWSILARDFNISRQEQELMANAFRQSEKIV